MSAPKSEADLQTMQCSTSLAHEQQNHKLYHGITRIIIEMAYPDRHEHPTTHKKSNYSSIYPTVGQLVNY